jgi:hypothetical protein
MCDRLPPSNSESDLDEGAGQAAKGVGEQGNSGGGADGRAGGSN